MKIEKENVEVICCFCGNLLPIKIAIVLNLMPNIESEESQQLFCHNFHLAQLIDSKIPLHPDFLT